MVVVAEHSAGKVTEAINWEICHASIVNIRCSPSSYIIVRSGGDIIFSQWPHWYRNSPCSRSTVLHLLIKYFYTSLYL